MKQLYYSLPYEVESSARVERVERKANNAVIELDSTLFYPQGGGQPSDVGEIIGPNGRLKVELVQFKDGAILHQGKLLGTIAEDDEVKLAIKWSHRHHSMRSHTAGHLIHEVVVATAPATLVPAKANHGNSAFVEYAGTWNDCDQEAIEAELSRLIAADLPVVMQESSLEEIQANCRYVPKGLPSGKPLRTVRIGGGELVPCGGVHVRSLSEIGRIIITRIEHGEGTTRFVYRIAGGSSVASDLAAAACLGGA
jgi:Ser-tRNA(Ala) deacylase AlaX